MTDEERDLYMERELKNDPYAERHYFKNQEKVEGIPINPIQRFYFDMTPNENRDLREIDDWWNEPYITTQNFGMDSHKEYVIRMGESATINKEAWLKERDESLIRWTKAWKEGIRYDVRCLNGDAWDRSTNLGHFDNLDDALELAKSYKKSI